VHVCPSILLLCDALLTSSSDVIQIITNFYTKSKAAQDRVFIRTKVSNRSLKNPKTSNIHAAFKGFLAQRNSPFAPDFAAT